METWTEAVHELFLPLAWACSSTPSANLLIKLLYRREPRDLSLLATDLHGVYYESLRGRQLHRRVDDAVASSSPDTQADSLGVMAGVGKEGEQLVECMVDELVDAVGSGRARAELSEQGFQQFVDVTLPSGTVFRFVMLRLDAESAQILASHLIQPLLGTSTALLSLLRQAVPDEKDLIATLEPAVDSSGRAERLSEGKNCSTFFRVGGAGLLKRWEQSTVNTKTKRNDPLQLSLPPLRSAPRLAVADDKRRTSVSPPTNSPPTPSFSPSKKNGLAAKMLDHRAKTTGERVPWDDSQPQPTNPGGEYQVVNDKNSDMDDEPSRNGEEEEEPVTDDDAEFVSPLGSTLPAAASERREGRVVRRSPIGRPSPLAAAEPSTRSSPPRETEPPSPSPDDLEAKKAKKKRRAEQEEAEALKQRRAKFTKLKAGPDAIVKKQRGGNRGL